MSIVKYSLDIILKTIQKILYQKLLELIRENPLDSLEIKANFYVSLLFVFMIILFLECEKLQHNLKNILYSQIFIKITGRSYERYFKNL